VLEPRPRAGGPRTVDLADVVVHHNDGGGIEAWGCALTAVDVVVRDNTAELGGGVALSGSTLRALGALEISGNTATRGGGVWGEATDGVDTSVLSGARIIRNEADLGGGVAVEGDGRLGNLELYDVEIVENAARVGGGVYQLDDYGAYVGERVQVRDNVAAEDGGGVYSGSGLWADAWSVSGNRADGRGGGLYLAGLWSGGEGLQVTSNVAAAGGAVYVDTQGFVTLTSLSLADNAFTDVETSWGDVLAWEPGASALVCEDGGCAVE